MSAAEKLWKMSRFEGENHWREQIDERLAAALPQIVAVVEALDEAGCQHELAVTECRQHPDRRPDWCSRCAALTALDEALS